MLTNGAMSKFGWEVTDTGGGCTAFTRNFDPGLFVLITDLDGVTTPDRLDNVKIGLFSDLNGTLIAESDRSEFASISDLNLEAEKLVFDHV